MKPITTYTDRCSHPECQKGTKNGVTLPCRYPADARPYTPPLPTCPECLHRAAYLADLDTDGKPLALFDCEDETVPIGCPRAGVMHLYVSPTLAHPPVALCACLTQLRWLPPTSAGYVRAWSALKARYGSYDCPGPDGSTWGYIGTTYPHGHTFRHRCLPPVNDCVLYHVPELPGDFAPAMEE
jgi:hypothetical protein